MTTYKRRYESFSELIDTAVKPASRSLARERGRADWYGTATFEDAVELARHGWSEGRTEVDSLIDELVGSLVDQLTESFVSVHDVEGGAVDVAAFLTGEPECMIRFDITEESAQREVVKILVSGFNTWNLDSRIIRNRGIAVCALLDLISRAGKSIELWVETCSASSGRGNSLHSELVKVKDAASYLDVNQVMYAMAHESLFRRIHAAAGEQEPERIRNTFGYYAGGFLGYRHSPIMADELGAQIVVEEIRDTRPFNDVRGMIEWVKSQLQTLGLLKKGE